MIIETTDNRLFSVRPHANPALAHVWEGLQVRRAKIRGTYELKPGARFELVRKEGSRVVSNFRIDATRATVLAYIRKEG
jgi:hypothetical protein